MAEAIIFVPMITIATYYSGDANVLIKAGIVTKAIEGLKKLKPSPLGVPESVKGVSPPGTTPSRRPPVRKGRLRRR